MASVSLAVGRDFKDKATGERVTDWVDVVAWNATAKFLSQYFTKGRMAVVEGRLQIRAWTDKDGNKRRSAEVVAEQIYFGDSKAQNPAPAAPPVDQHQPGTFEELENDDGELPF